MNGPAPGLEVLARRFARRFPVKVDGTSGTFAWERGDRPPRNPFEPARSHRDGRRSDGTSWCMWAYHAALGDTVQLKTIVRGQHKTYLLRATPAEGRAWLEWQVTRPGFSPGRMTARQWLAALDRDPAAGPATAATAKET